MGDSKKSKCPECGGRLFQAVPSITTEKEIMVFQQTAKMFKNAEYDKGWIHPGTYCYECNFAMLVEYGPPKRTKEEEQYYDEEVELIFELGKGKDRKTKIIQLRNYIDNFRDRPLSELHKKLKGKNIYSLGKMSRALAIWEKEQAEKNSITLKIVERKGPGSDLCPDDFGTLN
jgi:hypothetical protein